MVVIWWCKGADSSGSRQNSFSGTEITVYVRRFPIPDALTKSVESATLKVIYGLKFTPLQCDNSANKTYGQNQNSLGRR
jgi:hypothetical protein